jgi:hypothetical protein
MEPSALDAACRLVRALYQHRGAFTDAARLELDLARELGLELCAGQWTLLGEARSGR